MNRFPLVVAYKTLNLLIERKAIIYNGRKAFWVWTLQGRILVIFDPEMVDLGKLNEDFVHKLSTRLQGRLVVRTNSRGLFFQVDPAIPPVVDLTAKPLNLAEQPSPYHMGIGSTTRGDLWLSLLEGDSFFVTGTRNMGKTGELHAMIQSLLHGGQTLVYAWDGKENIEYVRYVGRPNFTLFPMHGLQRGLEILQEEAIRRMRLLAASGHPNITSWNAAHDPTDRFLPIALVIDEVAEVEDQSLLLKQVKVNRAAGLHPIFATNDPRKSSVIAKSQLGTRISFRVMSTADSMMGLGQPGANALPSIQGRGLIIHNGRMVEFQSFVVEYEEPTEEGVRWLEEHAPVPSEAVSNPIEETKPSMTTEIIQMAESIKDRWKPGMSLNKTSELLGKPYEGNSWCRKVKLVVDYLNSTTTTTQNGLISPDFGATAA